MNPKPNPYRDTNLKEMMDEFIKLETESIRANIAQAKSLYDELQTMFAGTDLQIEKQFHQGVPQISICQGYNPLCRVEFDKDKINFIKHPNLSSKKVEVGKHEMYWSIVKLTYFVLPQIKTLESELK